MVVVRQDGGKENIPPMAKDGIRKEFEEQRLEAVKLCFATHYWLNAAQERVTIETLDCLEYISGIFRPLSKSLCCSPRSSTTHNTPEVDKYEVSKGLRSPNRGGIFGH